MIERSSRRSRTLLPLAGVLLLLVALAVAGYVTFRPLGLAVLASLPGASEPGVPMDLTSKDLRRLNLLGQGELLLTRAEFDTETAWPVLMPSGFRPNRILEEGKNPGLGLRALHEQGFTGRGVSLGIIDQTLLLDHPEYRERIAFYEEIDAHEHPQLHGAAVASLAAGETVGVAPEASLYYVAIRMDAGRKARNIAAAISRLLEVNESLPPERQIRVISISASWSDDDPGYLEADAAARRAREQGVFVVSSVVEEYYDFSFHGLGRMPGQDPDDPASYLPGDWWANDIARWYPRTDPQQETAVVEFGGRTYRATRDRLLVPMDSRTTAGHLGPDHYIFYRIGGWSWAAPYVAGLYALALQVQPNLTPSAFHPAALASAYYVPATLGGRELSLGPIVNPAGLITAVQAK